MPRQVAQRDASLPISWPNAQARSFFIRFGPCAEVLTPEARLLGVEILGVFGSPWHSARPTCTQLLLERLNDPSLKVRRAAVTSLKQTERGRIQRKSTSTLSPHDLTQLNRAWDNLATLVPSHQTPRKHALSDSQTAAKTNS